MTTTQEIDVQMYRNMKVNIRRNKIYLWGMKWWFCSIFKKEIWLRIPFLPENIKRVNFLWSLLRHLIFVMCMYTCLVGQSIGPLTIWNLILGLETQFTLCFFLVTSNSYFLAQVKEQWLRVTKHSRDFIYRDLLVKTVTKMNISVMPYD